MNLKNKYLLSIFIFYLGSQSIMLRAYARSLYFNYFNNNTSSLGIVIDPWYDIKQEIFQKQYYITNIKFMENKKICNFKSRIFTLDIANPYNIICNSLPLNSGLGWYHYGRTFNEKNYPKPEEIFNNVNIIVYPKNPANRLTRDKLYNIYSDYIMSNYKIIINDENFIVFK